MEKESLGRIYDENLLEPIVQEAMDEHPSAILDFKSGNKKSINFLVGQVMRKTKSRADPDTVRRIVERKMN